MERVSGTEKAEGLIGGLRLMIDETYNPTDPEFLASRALDEQLTDEEQAVLDRALSESPTLCAEVRRLRETSAIVSRLAKDSVEIDWAMHAKLIGAELCGDMAEVHAVDGLLDSWGRRQVPLDEEAFTASVLGRIAPASSKRGGRVSRVIFRIGGPLVAAAVIALAVTLRSVPSGAPIVIPVAVDAVSVVSIGPCFAMLEEADISHDAPRAVVSFSRIQTPASASAVGRSSFRFVSFGVSPEVDASDESSPL